MKRIRQLVLLGAVLILASILGGESAIHAQEPLVVASTSWTAAMARAAGATNVAVLAPSELRHPAEYDFTVQDIERASRARYIIWGGYEPFIKKMAAVSGWPGSKLIAVQTDNYPSVIIPGVLKLAQVFGTGEKAASWQLRYSALVDAGRRAVKTSGAGSLRVVAHGFQAGFLTEMGYAVVGTIAPFGEMTPTRLHELVALRPDIVVDNWHNELGGPVANAAGCPHISLINFPGRDGTASLEDVLRLNCRLLGLNIRE